MKKLALILATLGMGVGCSIQVRQEYRYSAEVNENLSQKLLDFARKENDEGKLVLQGENPNYKKAISHYTLAALLLEERASFIENCDLIWDKDVPERKQELLEAYDGLEFCYSVIRDYEMLSRVLKGRYSLLRGQ